MAGGLDFYTKLLLHGDGANASTVITDSSFMANAVTATNATISTTAYKFGGSSINFNGSSAYCYIADTDDMYFGSGSFTIDLWVYFSSLTNAMAFIGQYQDANNYWYCSKDTNANGNKLNLEFKYGGSVKGSYVMTSAWSGAAASTWYHIAFVRNATTGLIFINGASQTLTETTAFSTNDVGNITGNIEVGRYNAGSYFYGYMDEMRVSKGVARWISKFTPPDHIYINDPLTYSYGSFAAPRAYRAKLTVHTKKRFYHEILYAEISPASANTHGAFRIIIKDPTRNLESDFGDFEPIWIGGKMCLESGMLMRGVVERTMPIRFKGGQWALEIDGRTYSCFAEYRKTASITPVSNKTIEQIIWEYVAPNVPELDFKLISCPTTGVVSSYTMINGRSYWDILKELAGLASTSSSVWAVWTDNGEYTGRPGIHFGPVKEQIGYSLIPIQTLKVFDVLAPKDTSQVVTRTIIGYNNSGALAYQTTDANGPGSNSTYSGNFSSAYVTITPSGDDLSFASGESFSIELWVYPTSVASGIGTWIVKGYAGAATTTNYMLRRNVANVEFVYRNSGDSAWDVYTTSAPALVASTWHHIVATYTMGAAASMAIYINGVKATGSWTTGTGNDAPSAPSGSLYLGARSVGGTPADYMAGYMDDVRIWSGLLKAKDVSDHYKGNYWNGDMLFYMDFEVGTGNPVDVSGMGATAVATSMTYYTYNNLPNSQSRFGVIPVYYDRSWAGSTEAQNYANTMLRLYRQPVRYVDASVIVDSRYRAGQYVYCTDKSFRGRAILDSVKHVITDDSYSEVVLLYM
jgi:hypothetical protein